MRLEHASRCTRLAPPRPCVAYAVLQVHRWYAEGEQPGLVYGRRGEPDSGEGICIVKVCARASLKRAAPCPDMAAHTLRFRFQAGSTFGVVTYTYPNVSAKVIPAFVKIVTANV